MSGGLSFCGLQQVKGNNGDIKYRQLNRPLFYFAGEIQLRNSEYIPFKTTVEVKSVQHFKNILTEEMRSKYGFDVGIDIEGCGIESKITIKNKSGESSSKSVKYSRKDFCCYKFRPVGCFTIDTKIRRLTESAVMDLECLKTKEDALKFLHKFGSHYPAPTNSFHYGGVEISHGSETYVENKNTLRKTKTKTNSASLKAKMGPVNLGGVSFEKEMGNNEVNEGNSRSIDVGFLSCDWMDYSSEEKFIKQVLSNPKHGRIITIGHDIVPVWDLIKDQYPVQTGPKLLGINKNSF
ncbi:hypothetical protein QYM36_000739 [Artemia franciscana]|uniref:Uncharacterized protein n=1 Tax=Artemia franciscana TaxID=6661 RepID=A0AA88LJS4_ARTSF|nr:hypothetical protein QYM36_000739 [Artemia franciscana]